MKAKVIKPELSAQGIRKTPNPMVLRSIARIEDLRGSVVSPEQLLVDQGCGQLRHLEIWSRLTTKITLVDTKTQLSASHEFYGKKMPAEQFVSLRYRTHEIALLNDEEFARSRLHANLIFCVNVFDVIPRKTRTKMLKAAYQNLAPEGIYVLIAPRNDTWTLRLCNRKNRFQDGHIFTHPRGFTFYRNWVDGSLLRLSRTHGFELLDDMSIFRHVCLLLRKRSITDLGCSRKRKSP